MGYYITTDDALSRFDSISKLYHDNATGITNTTWIEDDIGRVEALIHGFVGTRYTTPVTSADGILMLGAIGMKLLHASAYRRMPGRTPPDGIREAEEDARRDLHAIAKGTLVLAADAPEENVSRIGVVFNSNTPRFTQDKLKGF